jgi:hypothetical protein
MSKLKAFVLERWETLDLFWTYLRAVKTDAWNIAWGDGVLAVIFVLWWSVAPMPPLVIASFFGFAAIIAGYYIWRTDHLRLIPGIKLEEIRQQAAQAKDVNRTYIQLVLRCATETPIEECIGRLVRVWRWSLDDWEQIEPNQPLHLNWSPGVDQPISLSPGVPELLDVLYINNRVSYISFCSSWVPERATTIDIGHPSVLRFEIAVAGKDADSHKSLPTLPVSFKLSIQKWPVIDSIEQL